ncbi:MAG: deoxyribonuclease V [Synechococcales cyanobacterium RU_4_20]|nr:deoxyribonuclease V [Synechococcales cyanobacterium RU_4_20]NJR70350.1 deoxyribonuclease V [Synechococcales cyanobacterium CRU_2_2]
MQIPELTDWPRDAKAAIALQHQLAPQIITTDRLGEIATVAGVDVGFEDSGATTRAAVVLLSFPDLALIEMAIARSPTGFPYIPGLLSFREVPTVLKAFQQLKTDPDLILCDGQGIAHPRRFGIASHLGLLLDKPTIGVGKSRLVGTHEPVPEAKGAWVPLMDRGDRIGAVLRSRSNTQPLFISTGHRVSLETAIAYVLRCTPKYRLPETTRLADRLASRRGPMPMPIPPG